MMIVQIPLWLFLLISKVIFLSLGILLSRIYKEGPGTFLFWLITGLVTVSMVSLEIALFSQYLDLMIDSILSQQELPGM